MKFNEIIQSNKPVQVDFFAEWCGPCKMMAPVLKQVKEVIGDEATILKVDIDKSTKAAKDFQVDGVPTFIIFKNGKPVWRNSGVIPEAKLIEAVNNFTIKK